MSVGSEARLQVQWIELVYNTTGSDSNGKKTRREETEIFSQIEKRDGQFCENVCSIDETSTVGTTVLIQGSSASGLLKQFGGLEPIYFAVSVLSMILAFW